MIKQKNHQILWIRIKKMFVGIKPQKVSADVFKWTENTFKFGEDFINNCDENIYMG